MCVDIIFASNHLRTVCNKLEKAQRKFGHEQGALVLRKLQELKGLAALDDAHRIPTLKFHKLTGNRKGQWAVRVDQKLRIILVPQSGDAGDLVMLPDGTVDLRKVTCVLVKEVVDYHD